MQEIIKKVLEEYQWKYTENDGAFKVDVEGENSAWISFLRVENDDSVSYYSVLPVKVEEEKLEAISTLLLRINYVLRVGSFEINLSGTADSNNGQRGQIMFKTYGLITNDICKNFPDAAKEIVRRTIAFNMLTMDYYSKILLKAIYSDEINYDEIFNQN